ncbi:YeeE/YedE family protein [Limnohabitans sp. 2KL-17]|uniref:YeeE/YedE family protein n=1 Tax=Limnohabitans sp. 2KL-17 TaxID=1100704 RepID=UPI001E4A1867|nr:YeeE/YedE family protein [Limnohabitans sp. 2KL-17]
MITLEQLQLQTYTVLGLTFLLATAAGVLFHRSHFCTMGAISDWVIMGDKTRAKQWGLAMAVAVLGFGLMAWRGWVSPLNTIYASSQLMWLSLLWGGVLFGVGMVLGSGCASKSLIRLGGGNLKSLVVLMAMGISALATLRGLTAVWRVNSIDQVTVGTGPGPFVGQWLAAGTGTALPLAWLIAACVFSGLLFLWVFKDRQPIARSIIVSGAGIGAIVVALWWVSGVMGFVPEHPETLESVFLATSSGRMESMSFTAPVAYWWDAFMYFSDGSKRLTLGMAVVAGLLLGAFCSALLQGTFRWEGFTQTSDLGMHLLGGSLMGMGGVMAMGCTVGQGLSGLSTLSLGSFIAVLGTALGAVLALQWQLHRAESSL